MKLWIRIDAAVRSDPNVDEMARRLNMPFAEAVGLCVLVWGAIAEHRPNGDITGIAIPTLERWAGYEPRKGKPPGAFGAAFLELFTSDGEASGWHRRQGALIEKAEREKARKRRGNSADVPRKNLSTERNGTEQTPHPTALALVRAAIPETSHDSLDVVLATADNPTGAAYAIAKMAQGEPNFKPNPEQMGRATDDYAANGGKFTATYYREFVKRAIREDVPKPPRPITARLSKQEIGRQHLADAVARRAAERAARGEDPQNGI